MVYFCGRPSTPETAVEAAQHQRVLEFREQLPEQQLWWRYNQVAQFERLLREHLTRFIRERIHAAPPAAVPAPARPGVRFNLPRVVDEFRGLSGHFFSPRSAVRREAARQLRLLAPQLSLPELITFAESASMGERIGAAIGIGAQMEVSSVVCGDPALRVAITRLLDDKYSQVRRRAVEAISTCPDLRSALGSRLRELAEHDVDSDVQKAARRALGA
jgi:hypothetical protein